MITPTDLLAEAPQLISMTLAFEGRSLQQAQTTQQHFLW